MSVAVQARPASRYDMNPNNFAYSSEPYTNASELPQTGPTLLNGTETDILNNFFHQVPGFHPDQQILPQDLQDQFKVPQEYEWLLQDPPPTLHNVTAAPVASNAIQQQQQITDLSPHGNVSFSGVSEVNQIAHASHPEVIPNNSGQQQQNFVPNIFTSAHQAVSGADTQYVTASLQNAVTSSYLSPTSVEPTSASIDRSLAAHHVLFGLRPVQPEEKAAHQAEFGFGAKDQQNCHEDIGQRLYRFGSDSHFVGNGFIPQSQRDTARAVEKRLFRDFSGIRPIGSDVEDSRPASPSYQLQRQKKRRHGDESESSSGDDGDYDSKPRKRRKSRPSGGHDSSDDEQDHGGSMRRASHSIRLQRQGRKASHADVASRRRKSSPPPAKPPRENLTEEQKRNNHILSEQKRRNLIKSGFDELTSLVPELRQGGFSKSNMLIEAANYLELLMRGNEALRSILASK